MKKRKEKMISLEEAAARLKIWSEVMTWKGQAEAIDKVDKHWWEFWK